MPAKYTTTPKPCACCGDLFGPKPDEFPSVFHERKTCSKTCSDKIKGPNRLPTPPKTCVICGREFVIGPNERSTASFRKKITCSRSCANVLIARRRDPQTYAHSPLDLGERICVVCQSPFIRREGEASTDFRKRETCSKECGVRLSGERQRIADPERYCEVCGVRLERYATEKPKQFLVRTTCGGSCRANRAWQTRFATKTFAPRLYALGWPAIREQIKDRDNWTCQECGVAVAGGGAHVHHINYHKQDNRHENLITLCRVCHMKSNFNRESWQAHYERKMQERI